MWHRKFVNCWNLTYQFNQANVKPYKRCLGWWCVHGPLLMPRMSSALLKILLETCLKIISTWSCQQKPKMQWTVGKRLSYGQGFTLKGNHQTTRAWYVVHCRYALKTGPRTIFFFITGVRTCGKSVKRQAGFIYRFTKWQFATRFREDCKRKSIWYGKGCSKGWFTCTDLSGRRIWGVNRSV